MALPCAQSLYCFYIYLYLFCILPFTGSELESPVKTEVFSLSDQETASLSSIQEPKLESEADNKVSETLSETPYQWCEDIPWCESSANSKDSPGKQKYNAEYLPIKLITGAEEGIFRWVVVVKGGNMYRRNQICDLYCFDLGFQRHSCNLIPAYSLHVPHGGSHRNALREQLSVHIP